MCACNRSSVLCEVEYKDGLEGGDSYCGLVAGRELLKFGGKLQCQLVALLAMFHDVVSKSKLYKSKCITAPVCRTKEKTVLTGANSIMSHNRDAPSSVAQAGYISVFPPVSAS